MRWMWVIALAALCSACDEKKDPPEPAKTAAPEPKTLAAAELCELVMGGPKRALEKHCSADDKKDPAYAYLTGVADDRVKGCIAALKNDVGPGWATIPADNAKACSAALEKLSWKDAMLPRSIAAETACRDVVVGTQPADQACHRDVACDDGLFCQGGSESKQGSCKAPTAGAACEARAIDEIGWLVASTCPKGERCNVSAPPRRFALGFDRGLPNFVPADPASPGGFAEPVPGDDVAQRARKAALRDAVEFGMIGMLNSGASDEAVVLRGLDRIVRGLPPDDSEPPPVRPDEGIGLGNIGTDGNRYGVTGFGTGHGRLGSRHTKPPKVRMGATNVSGRLPPEVIQRIVRQNFGRFRLCYENGLRSNPNLQGRVMVSFVIARDGSVSSVNGGGDMPDSGVVSCVTRAFYGLSFPQPEGGIVTVSYPIVFTPGDEPRTPAKPSPEKTAPEGVPDLESTAEPDTARDAAPPVGDLCVPAESCAHAGDCAPTESCVENQCRGLGGNAAPCRESLDCDVGLYCKRSGETSACAPREKAGTPCTTSLACEGYCSKNDVCVDFCRPGRE